MGGHDAAVGEAKEENTTRRDELLRIQEEAQRTWAEEKVFEVDAPSSGTSEAGQLKYTANFPYPYMNGVLHVGHAFSLSKVEFATAFHRLCQKRVLFPQGFHCTGMPIKACADKLKGELEQFGNPPVFPDEIVPQDTAVAAEAEVEAASEQKNIDPSKFVGKKSKAAAKQGSAKTQWGILMDSGIPESEIPKFRLEQNQRESATKGISKGIKAECIPHVGYLSFKHLMTRFEPEHWLYYFPPIAINDITAMGCGVDWRRSFVTTDVNPYYDSFIRWQFNILREQGRISKAKRYSVYSPKDGQPCADHDRASGEGAVPQEYTLIKMRVLELPEKLKKLEGQGPVFLMAATLRPETMAGQTNCWILPDGDYGAYKGLNGEIYVMHPRSARNLAFQDRTATPGKSESILQFKGQDLIGTPLKAPKSSHERIYVLPLKSILTSKGTAVVTCVPSDSPDDFAAFRDIKNKPEYYQKQYGVDPSILKDMEPIPILEISGYGELPAEHVCKKFKVNGPNDRKQLEEAKKEIYLKGFTDGVMIVGAYAGQKISECKDKHKADLLEAGEAITYSEPERLVISRSGDECVVALTDQWYLNYGEPGWLENVHRELDQMDLYSEECQKQFKHVLGWLHEWACSRSFGLGTRVPWDPQYLIESLSDSTIYMAYYTVAHILQNGDIYGKNGGAIRPEDLTDAVWSHIFLEKEAPADTNIPKELMQRMRDEFNYWYPFDMRASGKDLIQNHLTFCLYNHAAIWQDRPDRWPKSIRCNGHLMLNAEKMSKSTGNFLTLRDAVKKYSADAVRMALADAGDEIDDANFEYTTANSAILRLTKELAWIEEVLAAKSKLRFGKTLFADRAFENDISTLTEKTFQAYDRVLFREALKQGCYELQKARDAYRVAVGPHGLEADLIMHYIEVSTVLLAPICPHTSHHIWSNLLQNRGSVLTAGWPETSKSDPNIGRQQATIDKLKANIASLISQEQKQKKKKNQSSEPPPKVVGAELHVAQSYQGWQATVLKYLQKEFDSKSRKFGLPIAKLGDPAVEAVRQEGTEGSVPSNKLESAVRPFAKLKAEEAAQSGSEYLELELPFSEADLIQENKEYLQRTLKLDTLEVKVSDGSVVPNAAGKGQDKAVPGQPVVVLLKQ